MPGDSQRYEPSGGKLIEAPGPSTMQEDLAVPLVALRYGFVTRHRRGKVFAAPQSVRRSDHNAVHPHLLFVGEDRRGIIGPKVYGRRLQPGGPDSFLGRPRR